MRSLLLLIMASALILPFAVTRLVLAASTNKPPVATNKISRAEQLKLMKAVRENPGVLRTNTPNRKVK